jgi:hypothetical protein
LTLKDEMPGKRFGKLTVSCVSSKRGKHTVWKCLCDCGESVNVYETNLRANHTLSCGCHHKQRTSESHTIHGGTHTPLYLKWSNMRRRCYDPTTSSYKTHGLRGITVCASWKNDFQSFRDWVNKTVQANNRRTNIIIVVGKEEITLADLSKCLGINYFTLYARLHKGSPLFDGKIFKPAPDTGKTLLKWLEATA